jgi:Arc/MetJ-type ribon-helix-helix transcriptional regulator
MEVQLTSDQEAFIRQAIEIGRLHRREDAVQEAMSLWEERERRRLEILVVVDQAEASLARGEGRRIATHEAATELAADIKRRGMARLAAEQNPRPAKNSDFEEFRGTWSSAEANAFNAALAEMRQVDPTDWEPAG